MKQIPIILTAFTITLFAGVLVAHAVAPSYTPLAQLPGTFDTATGKTEMGAYLSGMLKLLIALGAVVAVLMAVAGGTQYVAAGISPGAKSDAKERIIGALIGLGLILTSWLILNSINPNLVNFNLNLPAVGETTTAGGAPGAVPPTGPCSVTPLTPLSDSSVIAMENGAAVVWTSKDPNVNNNLIKLQAEFYKLDNALMLKDYGSGVTLTVNSAYRPIEYQKHLWEIWNKWKNQGLETSTNPNCATLKNEVGAEYSKHGLGSLVGSPNGCAPHVKGTGIDIRITNGTFSSSPSDTSNLLGINAFMQTAPPPSNTQIDLMWQGISGDEVHFNLKNPPYTGCATI